MIRSIAVSAGSETPTERAQQHAVDWARRFGARLRAVSAWDGGLPADDDVRRARESDVDRLVTAATHQGVDTDVSEHGDGIRDGLLAEARGNDMLVVGVPPDGVANDDVTAAILEEELPVLRRAEACVLVVSQPPPETKSPRVMVNYQGGVEGKAALRVAGNTAERFGGSVTVLSVAGDPAATASLTEAATDYLSVFPKVRVDALEHRGAADSESRVLEAADEAQADLIVLGAEPYGFFDRFLNRDLAEQVALSTERPLLMAR